MYVRPLNPNLLLVSYGAEVMILPVSQSPVNRFDQAQSPGILILTNRFTDAFCGGTDTLGGYGVKFLVILGRSARASSSLCGSAVSAVRPARIIYRCSGEYIHGINLPKVL